VWWRSCRRATWRCATDFRSVGYVDDELQPSRGERRARGLQARSRYRQFTVELFAFVVRSGRERSRFHAAPEINANI
jgi:hypothetical protein